MQASIARKAGLHETQLQPYEKELARNRKRGAAGRTSIRAAVDLCATGARAAQAADATTHATPGWARDRCGYPAAATTKEASRNEQVPNRCRKQGASRAIS